MIQFFVPGTPSPAGSKKYMGYRGGKPVLRDMGGEKTDNWRAAVAFFARQAHKGAVLTAPLGMSVAFFMPRPKSHYDKHGKLKASAPKYYTVRKRNDSDKLLRSTGDALSGVVYDDDSSVCQHTIQRFYCADDGKTGADIMVFKLKS